MTCRELADQLIRKTGIRLDPKKTCDVFKCGDPDAEITGVAVSMFTPPHVIRDALAAGANFLITHEPLYYNHMDEPPTYTSGIEKKKLIDASGICVFRFHDYAHGMFPDLICCGTQGAMSAKGTFVKGKYFAVNNYILDRPMTAMELACSLRDDLDLHCIRLCGCTDKPGTKVSCCFGTPGHVGTELEDNDFVLTGEISECEIAECARDYAELGYNKAVIVMGHIGSEREGMKLLARELAAEYPQFPTTYIECGEACIPCPEK